MFYPELIWVEEGKASYSRDGARARLSSDWLYGGIAASRPNWYINVHNGTDTSLRHVLASCCGVHMQPQTQKKVARADRIEGSIVLYRSAARSQFKAQKPLSSVEPWWIMVFGLPLFLRTVLRLVFVCHHWHKGPPITLRGSVPSNLFGCRPVGWRGSYITCLDCGQKFAYNHRTGRMVDFWGVHDAEALAGVRRRLEGFFSLLRGIAARGEGVPRLYVAQRPAADGIKADPVFAPAPQLSFVGSRTKTAPSSSAHSSQIPSAKKRALSLWINRFLPSISLAKWRRVSFAVLRKIGQSAFPTRLWLRRCWFDFKRDWSAMIEAMVLPKMKNSFFRWLHQPVRRDS
jgi:hypothetical protein